MCGIAGFTGAQDDGLLQRMGAALSHRGPDDSGCYCDPEVSLAHRRLKIIDLSDAGRQPFVNEDRSLVLIYNGEIYNFASEREQLQARGHRFRSRSDGEVILHLYEELGEASFAHWQGMFAFALWDKLKHILWLVRDPLGIKPLYYAPASPGVYFASELKALRLCPAVSGELDPQALEQYLGFRYCRAPKSMLRGACKLPPGHYLKCTTGGISLQRYWQWDFTPRDSGLTLAEYQAQLRQLLERAVHSHMVSDVPLGLHLSGGVDSAALLALMSRRCKVQCFTLGFGSPHDELAVARKLARTFGAEHHSYELQPSDLELFPQVAAACDEPVGDAIILPIYLLYRLSRGALTVVLTGEGADELFGGYIHDLALARGERWRTLLPPGLKALAARLPEAALNRVFPYPARLGASGAARLAAYLGSGSRAEAYASLAALFSAAERTRLYTPEWSALNAPQDSEFPAQYEGFQAADPLTQVLNFDLSYWLPDYTLLKQDRISMAHSQEGRFPFLDCNLVQWALTLPPRYKITGFTQKYLLRTALAGLLPEWARRRGKQAFYFPVDRWLQGKFGAQVRGVLEDLGRRGIVQPEFVQGLWRELNRDPLLRSKQIMALYILELWLQEIKI